MSVGTDNGMCFLPDQPKVVPPQPPPRVPVGFTFPDRLKDFLRACEKAKEDAMLQVLSEYGISPANAQERCQILVLGPSESEASMRIDGKDVLSWGFRGVGTAITWNIERVDT